MTAADQPPFTPPQVPYVAIAPPTQPVITLLILLVLCAIFAAEMLYGIGPPTGTLQPSIETLVGFGGLSRDLVMQSGDWYRLFSAPFLHASAVHLGMNAVALWVAGRSLERLVGHAWFAATYAVGALGGSIASLELNPPGVVGVGASGAIMGLFATMLIISMHFPASPVRSALRSNAIYVLIPSLLPLANALKTETKVDYAAHTGGAIAGAVVGLLLLVIWPRSEPNPRLKGVAVFLALAGVIALVYPLNSILQGGYDAAAFSQKLIPPDKYPKTGTEMRARASQLIAQYPRDPRPHFTRAADLLDARDLAGAEREARAGLEEEYLWHSLLPRQVGDGLRTFLAIAISRDRPQEALDTARPVCLALKDGPMRRMLDERRLCKT
jgi:rhomboid protease GluP